MAQNKKQQETEATAIDNLNESLTSAGQKIANNGKKILMITCGVAVVALLVIGYIFFIQKPKEAKSNDAFNNVELTAQGNDSIATAGYIKVADQYKGTVGGNLAALSAGEALYDQGKYQEAAKYLEQFKTDDEVMMANAQILLGDCYVNMKKYDEALGIYDHAIRTSGNNPEIAPRVLDKKARIYDEQKKYAEALECYQTIEKQYPRYQNGGYPVAAYIAREEARLGK